MNCEYALWFKKINFSCMHVGFRLECEVYFVISFKILNRFIKVIMMLLLLWFFLQDLKFLLLLNCLIITSGISENFFILIRIWYSNRFLFPIYLKMFIRHLLTGSASSLLRHLGLLCYGHWITFLLTFLIIKQLPRDPKRWFSKHHPSPR